MFFLNIIPQDTFRKPNYCIFDKFYRLPRETFYGQIFLFKRGAYFFFRGDL